MLAAIIMSTLIIGHRGASGHVPENTLPAFHKAIELGADGVELDIWPDADGTPMVIHDEKLDRTFHHRGKVTSLLAHDLVRIGVPRYQDVLDMARGRLVVFTELKGPHEDKVAEVIHLAVRDQNWNYEDLPVIGFDHDQLARLKDANPALVVGVSFSQKMMQPIRKDAHATFMISRANHAGAAAINPDYRLVTKELVDKAHSVGLKVNVWTVNRKADMEAMLALGVDSIMTDFPDRLHALMQGEKSGD